jgi:hypothetical protein
VDFHLAGESNWCQAATLAESSEASGEGQRGPERYGWNHACSGHLGFANRTLGLRLPPKTTKAGGELRTRLQKRGSIRDTGHKHCNGSLVVPITDSAGDGVEMYGRKVTEKVTPGTPLHLCEVDDGDLERVSPMTYEHINLLGRYEFRRPERPRNGKLRELNTSSAVLVA